MRKSDFRKCGWWYCNRWNIILGCAPKCGSTALFKVISDHNIAAYNPEKHNFTAYAVWIVREPVARFWSLWKDKCRDGDILWEDGDDDILAGFSPEELMSFIENTNEKDIHWATQQSQCGNRANELVPLEKLSKWWKNRGFPDMEPLNTSEGDIDMSEELVTRILKHYAKDVALYELASANDDI